MSSEDDGLVISIGALDPSPYYRKLGRLPVRNASHLSSEDLDSESRDDGEQPLPSSRQLLAAGRRKHLAPRGDRSTVATPSISHSSATSSPRSTTKHSSINTSSRHHRKNNPSLNTLHVELLRAERERLLKRLKGLGAEFDLVQRHKAYEKSKFLMRRGQLLVEIEGSRDDKNFLAKKREQLSERLLDLHMNRLEIMDQKKKG